jgi:hypothetical protein
LGLIIGEVTIPNKLANLQYFVTFGIIQLLAWLSREDLSRRAAAKAFVRFKA